MLIRSVDFASTDTENEEGDGMTVIESKLCSPPTCKKLAAEMIHSAACFVDIFRVALIRTLECCLSVKIHSAALLSAFLTINAQEFSIGGRDSADDETTVSRKRPVIRRLFVILSLL